MVSRTTKDFLFHIAKLFLSKKGILFIDIEPVVGLDPEEDDIA